MGDNLKSVKPSCQRGALSHEVEWRRIQEASSGSVVRDHVIGELWEKQVFRSVREKHTALLLSWKGIAEVVFTPFFPLFCIGFLSVLLSHSLRITFFLQNYLFTAAQALILSRVGPSTPSHLRLGSAYVYTEGWKYCYAKAECVWHNSKAKDFNRISLKCVKHQSLLNPDSTLYHPSLLIFPLSFISPLGLFHLRLAFSFVLFWTPYLRCNSRITQLRPLKVSIQWCSVSSQSCATITTQNQF